MEFLEILSAAGFSAAGVGAIVKLGLETDIKEAISNVYRKELEEHKFLLKNSEAVFNFKLEASKALYKIYLNILPKREHPDMDWEEACIQISSSFEIYEKELNEFLCEYQATLTDDILKRIKKAISACSDGSYAFYWDAPQFDTNSYEKANELFDSIQEAVEILRREVHEMISTPAKNT
ncbi:hypothetical protein OA39_05000 [Vibrio campbellii]|uniref:hypothetical protein n=1 Tax=Vibrio campbellii TaxID=680 RepID=UPI000530D1D0|nr:hypothetical protein [Vibrio campbellii]KGR32635.1 hypothetical protein OA39_05000 [Vibrio campbellii]